MSVPCKIEASPWRLLVGPSRVVPDGGGADEQGGTFARRYPRARRPRRAAGGRGRLAPGAERAAGLPPAPTVPGRGCFWPRLAPARAAEQPPAAGVGPRGRARGRARALRRLRPDARGREAGRGPRPAAVPRDLAAVDGRGRPVGAAQGPPRARPPAPPPPGLPGRAGPDRRLRARLVRGPRPGLHAARLRRRRHQPADAPPVRAGRERVRLHGGDARLRRDSRQAGRLLLRQARHLPGQPPGRRRRGRDPVRSRPRRADHRHHLRQQPAGQGPGRAGAQDLAGPAREGAAGWGGGARWRDRLVKEWRRAGVGTIEAANAFLPGFVADYNARFAKPARRPEDLHRPPAPHDDLDEALTWREERTVTGSLTLHYNKVLFLLEPTDVARGLARKRVTVHEFPDGRLTIRHQGVDLPYRTFDKLRRVGQAAVVENKRLGAVLAHIRDRQAEPVRRRTGPPPSRSFQPGHMFPD